MCRVQSSPIPTDDGKADGKEDGKDETVEAILELARVVAPLPWELSLSGVYLILSAAVSPAALAQGSL